MKPLLLFQLTCSLAFAETAHHIDGRFILPDGCEGDRLYVSGEKIYRFEGMKNAQANWSDLSNRLAPVRISSDYATLNASERFHVLKEGIEGSVDLGECLIEPLEEYIAYSSYEIRENHGMSYGVYRLDQNVTCDGRKIDLSGYDVFYNAFYNCMKQTVYFDSAHESDAYRKLIIRQDAGDKDCTPMPYPVYPRITYLVPRSPKPIMFDVAYSFENRSGVEILMDEPYYAEHATSTESDYYELASGVVQLDRAKPKEYRCVQTNAAFQNLLDELKIDPASLGVEIDLDDPDKHQKMVLALMMGTQPSPRAKIELRDVVTVSQDVAPDFDSNTVFRYRINNIVPSFSCEGDESEHYLPYQLIAFDLENTDYNCYDFLQWKTAITDIPIELPCNETVEAKGKTYDSLQKISGYGARFGNGIFDWFYLPVHEKEVYKMSGLGETKFEWTETTEAYRDIFTDGEYIWLEE